MATWQSTSIEINAGAVYELSILAGKANIFMATNASNQDIYVGMGSIPRIDHYEKLLERNTVDVFGRPTTVSRVYFLNASAEKVSFTVWYTYDEDFDYMLLKSMTVNLQGAALDAIKFDGIIQGFKTGISLPVTATQLTTTNNLLQQILTATQQNQTTNTQLLSGVNSILDSI